MIHKIWSLEICLNEVIHFLVLLFPYLISLKALAIFSGTSVEMVSATIIHRLHLLMTIHINVYVNHKINSPDGSELPLMMAVAISNKAACLLLPQPL
jgi:hypothetical protein